MSTTMETNRLAALIEDLTRELYEASRARGKEHRETLSRVEDTLALAQEILTRLKREDTDSEEETVKVSLKATTIAKILPWLLAGASGVAELIHRLYH